MKKTYLLSLVLLATTSFVSNVRAAGFLLNDHGAAAAGRANAVVATTSDPSAVFHNVAGLGRAEQGVNVSIGTSIINPNSGYTDPAGNRTASQTPTAIVPNLYANWRVNQLFSAGIGVFSPFGSKLVWGANSPGRDVVREQQLRTFFISPAIGLNLDQYVKGLTLGAGVDFVPASVSLKNDLFMGDTSGAAAISGTAFGYGGRAGIQYHPEFLPGLSLGAAYRSAVGLNFSGNSNINIAAPYRSQLPPDGAVSSKLTTPQSVLGGVGYRLSSNLQVEFNVNWIDWSSYKELKVKLPGTNANGQANQKVATKNYHDTLVYRAGIEYQLPNQGIGLRAGYAYDPTPIPKSTLDFSLPDANRHLVSVGGSYALPMNMYVDIGLAYVLPSEKSTGDAPSMPTYKGTYDISAFVGTINLGMHFMDGKSGRGDRS